MGFNPFIGRSLVQLQADLQAAQDDLAAGKVIEGSGVGETRKKERFDSSPRERIRAILKALSILNPTLYPPGCAISPDRQTRATFRPEASCEGYWTNGVWNAL
jgi:hypothetical protein